jgi:hypothetical protein
MYPDGLSDKQLLVKYPYVEGRVIVGIVCLHVSCKLRPKQGWKKYFTFWDRQRAIKNVL